MSTQISAEVFIEDVKKLHAYTFGGINLEVCMAIIKEIHGEGYTFSPRLNQNFIIKQMELVNIITTGFKLFNTIKNSDVTVKIVEREIAGKIYNLVINYQDSHNTKYAQVYMINEVCNNKC